MIKVESKIPKKLTDHIIDAGADITIDGGLPIVAIELANLLTLISDKYPEVMDMALKLIKDHNELRKEVDNDKTDINNNR